MRITCLRVDLRLALCVGVCEVNHSRLDQLAHRVMVHRLLTSFYIRDAMDESL